VIAKTRKSTLAAATIVALALTWLGVSAIAATSAKNTAATGYVVCISKSNGDMKLRSKSTCPKGFTTKVFGAKGPAGLTGAQGIQGEAGPAGAQGAAGLPGSQGEAGPQGVAGEQGLQGPQGLPGRDGSAAAIYTGLDFGQDSTLLTWSGENADYKIATTDKTLPTGTYLVTGTSSFRNGTDDVECWLSVDSLPLFQGGIARVVDSYAGAPIATQAVMYVPEGGSKISLGCYRTSDNTPSMTNFETGITALAVGEVNP
jgi:hypothetical protein